MHVLDLHLSRRFAVKRTIALRDEAWRKRRGLLIELWPEGCRFTRAGPQAYVVDQEVTIDLGGGLRLSGYVQSETGKVVRVKFAEAIRRAKLNEIVESSRAPQSSAA